VNYTYQIKKIEPKAEFLVVVYSSEGYPDFTRSYNPTDFSEENISAIIHGGAAVAVEFWQRQDAHPEEVELPTEGSGSYEPPVVAPNFNPNHAPEIEPQPEFDPFTQYITLNQIEDPMQATVGWTVHDMTAEEQAEFLSGWRSFTQVTPRQARLELAKRGLLANIAEIIALIPEPDKTTVEIEWEYAVSIERSSPWVIQLGSALGLDEEGLDELFKAAAEL